MPLASSSSSPVLQYTPVRRAATRIGDLATAIEVVHELAPVVLAVDGRRHCLHSSHISHSHSSWWSYMPVSLFRVGCRGSFGSCDLGTSLSSQSSASLGGCDCDDPTNRHLIRRPSRSYSSTFLSFGSASDWTRRTARTRSTTSRELVTRSSSLWTPLKSPSESGSFTERGWRVGTPTPPKSSHPPFRHVAGSLSPLPPGGIYRQKCARRPMRLLYEHC